MATPGITEVVRDLNQLLTDVDHATEHALSLAADRLRDKDARNAAWEIDSLRRSIRSEVLTLASCVESLESEASRGRQVPLVDRILAKEEAVS